MALLNNLNFVRVSAFVLVISSLVNGCDQKFEGFGVYLGSNTHFGRSIPGIEAKVLQVVYEFLGIRYYRTSYEEFFSPEENKYEINCTDGFSCAWINVHKVVAALPDVKVFASIWSPPHYMKNDFYQLLPEYETAYLHFIKNITAIIQQDFNITIEKVSPVNEPENVFAPWDHTNMDPDQLCRIIKAYDDPLISICPENSYFWVSKIYFNFESDDPTINCSSYCEVQATHAYALNLDMTSNDSFQAYYDMKAYDNRGTTSPIWMTEVSSTYSNANNSQIQEALDLATNIVNFVGTTCVQRYYFWYAYTLGYSGESLIWGDENGNLYFPKKFFVFKMFVNASQTINGPVEVNICDFQSLAGANANANTDTIVQTLECIQFGDEDRVLVNRAFSETQLVNHDCFALCCTTEADDLRCNESRHIHKVPARSVCHCMLNAPVVLNNSIII